MEKSNVTQLLTRWEECLEKGDPGIEVVLSDEVNVELNRQGILRDFSPTHLRKKLNDLFITLAERLPEDSPKRLVAKIVAGVISLVRRS